MKRLIGGCALVALLLWPLAGTAQTRAQVVEEIEAGETVPISEEGALEMPTDVDDADDIRDDNNPDDIGQEALGGEEEDAP
jgi:hypothetical protein